MLRLGAAGLGLVGALACAAAPGLPWHADGLGAFRLGAPLNTAARQMARLDRAALQIGPGCDERPQSVVTLPVAGLDMTVMAMADARGRIAEVVASAPHQGPPLPEAACQQQAQRWAQQLAPGRVLPPQTVQPHGAARVGTLRLGEQAWVESRWFAGGRTCDVSLHYAWAAAR